MFLICIETFLIFNFFVQNESCCHQPLPVMEAWFWIYIKTEYVYLNIIISSSKVKKILIRSALPTYGANQKLDLGIYIMKANVNERSEIYTPTLVWILINLNRKIERYWRGNKWYFYCTKCYLCSLFIRLRLPIMRIKF